MLAKKVLFCLTLNRGKSLACSQAWAERIGTKPLSSAVNDKNVSMKCQQRCDLQNETPTFTSSNFPIEATFPRHHFICLTLKKVSRICNDSQRAKIFQASQDQASGITCKEILNANNTNRICEKRKPIFTMTQQNPKMCNFLYNYAKNNFAYLSVFFKDPYYTLIKRDEQLPLITFLGNTGGLLGLCMGLSLVSIFEIFYHFINFAISRCQKMFLNR